jgi:hypothetical protein
MAVGDEERRHEVELEQGARIDIRRKRDPEKGLDWAAALTIERGGRRHTVYLYDNAHGQPERHRYRGGQKLEAEALPSRGSARLDLPAAIEEIKARWRSMVGRWEP